MKKTLIFSSLTLLLVLVLSGCGNDKTKEPAKGDTATIDAAISSYIDNLANLQNLETKVYQAIEKEDGEAFDTAVAELQKETQLALESIKKVDQAGQDVSSSFIPVVLAKEKSSLFYHMPVIKHFAKAYDEALKNKKTAAYNYLKNDIDEVEKNNILKRNNLKNLEDFNRLDGTAASKIINSESELYKMVSWTKITTDVGKAGVNAFVDALKGDNPLSAKEIGKDYLTEKFKNSQKKTTATVKIKKGKGSILGVNKKFKDGIDTIIPYDESIEHVITDQEEAEIQNLLASLDEKVLFGRKVEATEEQTVSLPAGDWNLTIGIPKKGIEEKQIKTVENQTVEVSPADFGLNEVAMPEDKKVVEEGGGGQKIVFTTTDIPSAKQNGSSMSLSGDSFFEAIINPDNSISGSFNIGESNIETAMGKDSDATYASYAFFSSGKINGKYNPSSKTGTGDATVDWDIEPSNGKNVSNTLCPNAAGKAKDDKVCTFALSEKDGKFELRVIYGINNMGFTVSN